IFAMALMGVGLISVLATHLIPGAWLILVGLFLKSSAENEYRSFELRFGLQDMTVREVMVPPVAVQAGMTISEVLYDYVFHYHYPVFPVVKSGRFVGMIDVRAIKAVKTNDWPTTTIDDFLSDPSSYSVISPDIKATDALRQLLTQNTGKGPVVQDG